MPVLSQPPTPTRTAQCANIVAQALCERLLSLCGAAGLLSRPLAPALASALVQIHARASMATGASVPFQPWIQATLGLAGARLDQRQLGSSVAERMLGIVSSIVDGASQSRLVSPIPTAAIIQAMPQVPGPPTPTDWNESKVFKSLASLMRIGALELSTLPRRLALAETLAGVGIAMPGVRSSSTTIGQEVHRSLQQTYIRNTRNLVVSERCVWGGMVGYTGQNLKEVAMAGGDTRLSALNLSSMSKDWALLKKTDLTDLSAMQSWEIKPIGEAHVGVLQEAWYRCAYNWCVTNLAASLNTEEPPLMPGTGWNSALMGNVPLKRIGGQPAVAVPFSTLALPGLLLYVVVSGPTMTDLVLLTIAVQRFIDQQLKQLILNIDRGLAGLARTLLDHLDVLGKWLCEHFVQIIIWLAIAGLAVAAILALPGAAAGSALLVPVSEASGVLLFMINELRRGGAKQAASEQDKTPITLDFPGVSVRLRAADAAPFCAAMEDTLRQALSAFSAHFPAPPSDNVA